MNALKKSIQEKLTASLEMFAKKSGVPVNMVTYSKCFKALSLKNAEKVLQTLPTAWEILKPKEFRVFAANGRVARALSYIERWKISLELGRGEELLNTPFCFAVRRKNDITNFAVVSSSCENAKIKVVELWTAFSSVDGYSRDFPETVLAVEGNVVFTLVFKPAEVMTLLGWNDVWDVPEITSNFKARLEEYTRIFRQTYAKRIEDCQSLPSCNFSISSVDEYIGNDERRIVGKFGSVIRKDWRKLKRLFNVGRIIYLAEYNRRHHVVKSPLKDVVFTKPIGNAEITFVYIKGNWDIEFPISNGVILRMVPDFTKVKRISRKLSK